MEQNILIKQNYTLERDVRELQLLSQRKNVVAYYTLERDVRELQLIAM